MVVRCRPLNSKEVEDGRARIVDMDIKAGQVTVRFEPNFSSEQHSSLKISQKNRNNIPHFFSISFHCTGLETCRLRTRKPRPRSHRCSLPLIRCTIGTRASGICTTSRRGRLWTRFWTDITERSSHMDRCSYTVFLDGILLRYMRQITPYETSI